MKQKVAVIGGGLSGLSAAFHLKEAGKEYFLFEKEEEPGGLAASFLVNGFSFDYTGHYLHFKTNYGRAFVQKLLKKNIETHYRRASVFAAGEYIPYPFQYNYSKMKNKNIANACKQGLEEAGALKKTKAPENFKEWIIFNLGNGIAEHFMVPYNEKLYKSDLSRLLVKGPVTYVPDIKIKTAGYNNKFYYPSQGGIKELSKAINERVCDRVLLSAKVTALDGSTVTFNGNRKITGFDSVISTVPLPELIPLIKGAPKSILAAAKRLKYVSVFALNLGIDRAALNKNHWIYYSAPDISFYRVGFYSSVSGKLCPPRTSSLYAEVSVKQGAKFDGKKLAERIKKDLLKTGILTKSDSIIAEQALFVKYAYVVFDLNYGKNMAVINKYLKQKSIISIGRYGAWNYSAMEDALLDGRAASVSA